MSRLILASASPRRRELLSACGLDFEVCVLPVRECTTASDIRKLPEINAALKADAVSAAFPEALAHLLECKEPQSHPDLECGGRDLIELLQDARQKGCAKGL